MDGMFKGEKGLIALFTLFILIHTEQGAKIHTSVKSKQGAKIYTEQGAKIHTEQGVKIHTCVKIDTEQVQKFTHV